MTTTQPRTFAVTLTEPEVHDRDTEHVIRVDDRRIGGIYMGTEGWVSYGPAGYVFGQGSVEIAAEVQVREYAIDPSGYERMQDDLAAEIEREQAEREAYAEDGRRQRAEKRRRQRLGDDEPGPTVLTVPAYHALYAPDAEVQAVSDWLNALGVDYVSAVHEVRVERRADRFALVYERCAFGRDGETQTWVVTVTEPLPQIATPARPDLHALLAEHWPTRYPLVDYGQSTACTACTRAAGPARLPADLVAWPCSMIHEAITG